MLNKRQNQQNTPKKYAQQNGRDAFGYAFTNLSTSHPIHPKLIEL